MWFIILLSFSVAFVLVEVKPIPLPNGKPFNCATCLSGWCCLALYHKLDLYTIPLMCLAMVTSIVLTSLIKKYL